MKITVHFIQINFYFCHVPVTWSKIHMAAPNTTKKLPFYCQSQSIPSASWQN